MTITAASVIGFIVFLVLMWLVYIGIDRFVSDADLKKFLTYALLVIIVIAFLGMIFGFPFIHFAK